MKKYFVTFKSSKNNLVGSCTIEATNAYEALRSLYYDLMSDYFETLTNITIEEHPF